jgi:hypothetical protein
MIRPARPTIAEVPLADLSFGPTASSSPPGGNLAAARLTAFGQLALDDLFATANDDENAG